MASHELLESYLNDHLAGATAGVDLARKIADQTRDTPTGPALARLADDIEADRATLEGLIEKLSADQHGVKQVAAWMAEKLSRLRLNRVSAGSESLALMMSMETLSMGIEGKRNLWQSLQEVAASEPAIAALDLPSLEKRALSQRDLLETYRRALAPMALTGSEVTSVKSQKL